MVILVAVSAFGERVKSAEPRLYPLTQQQAVDESTLDPVILADRTVPSRTHPDQEVRWVKVRFFSHDWKDGRWHAEMTIAMPPKIRRDRLGFAAITLAGVGKKGIDISDAWKYKGKGKEESGAAVGRAAQYQQQHLVIIQRP